MKFSLSSLVKNIFVPNVDFHKKTLKQIISVQLNCKELQYQPKESVNSNQSASSSEYQISLQEAQKAIDALKKFESRIQQTNRNVKSPRFFELTETPELLNLAKQIATKLDTSSIPIKREFLNTRIVEHLKTNELKEHKLTIDEIVQVINCEINEVHGFGG